MKDRIFGFLPGKQSRLVYTLQKDRPVAEECPPQKKCPECKKPVPINISIKGDKIENTSNNPNVKLNIENTVKNTVKNEIKKQVDKQIGNIENQVSNIKNRMEKEAISSLNVKSVSEPAILEIKNIINHYLHKILPKLVIYTKELIRMPEFLDHIKAQNIM